MDTDGRVARRTGTKAAIIDAAVALFAAKGVSSTTLDDVAAAAEVSKGSIFYNFGSKDALVEAVLGSFVEAVKQRLDAEQRGLGGIELRRATVRAMLGLIAENADASRMLASEFFRTDRSWIAMVERWRGVTSAALVADCRRGSDDEAACELQAASLIGATLMAGLAWLTVHPRLSVDTAYGQVARSLGLD